MSAASLIILLIVVAAAWAGIYFHGRRKPLLFPPGLSAKAVQVFSVAPGQSIENISVSKDEEAVSIAVREVRKLLETKCVYYVHQEGKVMGPFDEYHYGKGAWAAAAQDTAMVPKTVYAGTAKFSSRPGFALSEQWYSKVNSIQDDALFFSGTLSLAVDMSGEAKQNYIVTRTGMQDVVDYALNLETGAVIYSLEREGKLYLNTGHGELGPFDGIGFLAWAPDSRDTADFIFTAYLETRCFLYKGTQRHGPYYWISGPGFTPDSRHFFYVADYSIYVDDEVIHIEEGRPKSIKFSSDLTHYAYHIEIVNAEDNSYKHYLYTNKKDRYGPFSGPPQYTFAPVSEALFIFGWEFNAGAYQPVAFFAKARIDLNSLISQDVQPIFSSDGLSFSLIDRYKQKLWVNGVSRIIESLAEPLIAFYDTRNVLTYLIRKQAGLYFVSGLQEYGPYTAVSDLSKANEIVIAAFDGKTVYELRG
ncbi:hypothetical protein FACS1894200_00550 [Spirochaetia bacterium]|nr:hypothetical protein FACS1894200_00550 [Spirochaetia bacterium]